MKLYNELAKYVDITYSTKNYELEVQFMIDIFKRYKIKPLLIYDVACGSGNHSKILLEKGYNIVDVDLNRGMINVAKKKVSKLRIYQQDMRKLNMKEKADCIITMFNAINHFSSYRDFEMMLRSYWNNLNNKGVVIFDTMFDQKNWPNEFNNSKIIRTDSLIIGKVDRAFRINEDFGFVHQVFNIFEGKKQKVKILESKYLNFIYDIDKMKKIIDKVGFRFRLYYDFSLTAKRKNNCYNVFVLQKIE